MRGCENFNPRTLLWLFLAVKSRSGDRRSQGEIRQCGNDDDCNEEK